MTRPSIAELQRADLGEAGIADVKWHLRDVIMHGTAYGQAGPVTASAVACIERMLTFVSAAPILLEIASAALRFRAGMTRDEIETGRCEALDRALSKVAP
jgi:hypothetical protein